MGAIIDGIEDNSYWVTTFPQSYLMVCLCDVSAEDARMVVNGMPLLGCAQHGNAAKLKALRESGLGVSLYAKNKHGEIVSVLTGAP